ALDESPTPGSLLLTLPVDVIRHLIYSLDGKAILSLARTCRRLYKCVEKDVNLLNLLARKLGLPVQEGDPLPKVQSLIRFFKRSQNPERGFYTVLATEPPRLYINRQGYLQVREKMRLIAAKLETCYGSCALFSELQKPLRAIEAERIIVERALPELPD